MSSLTTIPIASRRLAWELWISLASLLRSHVEMRALAKPAAGLRVVASSEVEVRIKSSANSLRVLAPGASGTGVVEFNAPGHQTWFFFAADGLVYLDQAGLGRASEDGMEMETAIESLLDRMTG